MIGLENKIDVRLPDGPVVGKFPDNGSVSLPPGVTIETDELGRRHINVATLAEAQSLPGIALV